jgi:hypothetical protein
MKRAQQVSNAIALVQARRKALNLPVSSVPTKVTDTTLYLVARVDGLSNIAKLTNDDTKKKVGVTNFDGNKLADGRDAIIDSIKIEVAKDGLILNNVDWVGKKVNLPSELANAELKLKQGEKILLNIAVSDLVLSNDDDNYRDIASTPYLGAKEPIEWTLELADGSTVPVETVDGVYIKISCRAIQAIQ